MRRCNKFTKVLCGALRTPYQAAPGTPPTIGNTKIVSDPTYKSVARILKRSEALIGDYYRLNKLILDAQDARPEGVAESWADHVEQTARLLEIGVEAAINNVKKMLGASVDDGGEEGEKMGAVDDMKLNYGLRESFQFAERGVRNMARNVPYDEQV